MKTMSRLAVLAAVFLCATAVADEHAGPSGGEGAAHAHEGHGGGPDAPPEAQAAPSPAEVLRDFSYTMGYNLGARLRSDIGSVDGDAFVEGFRAASGGQPPRIDESAMQEAVMAFQAQRQVAQEEARQQQAQRNAADGQAFLEQNRKRRGVKVLPSGLQYEVIRKGTGTSPSQDDLVSAHYRGTLPDGTVFDASEAEPVTFALSQVIKGWQEGVGRMNRGAKYRLYVPSDLAYGEQGAGDVIGPNQVLVFEVELVDFTPGPVPVPQDE